MHNNFAKQDFNMSSIQKKIKIALNLSFFQTIALKRRRSGEFLIQINLFKEITLMYQCFKLMRFLIYAIYS